jgi:hypothetical protein
LVIFTTFCPFPARPGRGTGSSMTLLKFGLKVASFLYLYAVVREPVGSFDFFLRKPDPVTHQKVSPEIW